MSGQKNNKNTSNQFLKPEGTQLWPSCTWQNWEFSCASRFESSSL